MSTPVIVAVLTAAALIVGTLITVVVGPVIYPWYGERMSKAQLRVQRRIRVREMIERELSKGILDLGAVRAYFTYELQQPAEARNAFIQVIMKNETDYGVWLGYAVEDSDLRNLCEQYRDLIRDIRVVAIQPPPPADMEARIEKANKAADKMAGEIMEALNRLGW